jgi:hypothetical protein
MSVVESPMECPYVGLEPFDSAHATYFFGRHLDSKVIVDHVLARPVTVLYGPSGIGKSSILNVGIEAALPCDEDGHSHWIIVRLRSWQEPDKVEQLATVALAEALPRRPLRLPSRLRFAPLVAWTTRTLRQPVLLILDQFEEYFLYANREQRQRMEAAVSDLLNRDLWLHVLFAIRDDSLHQLDQFRTFFPPILETTIELGPLTDAGVEDAIRGPISRYNAVYRAQGRDITVEDGLVTTLIRQLKQEEFGIGKGDVAIPQGQRIELPYLQIVLTQLWTEEGGSNAEALHEETLVNPEKLGGVHQVVRNHVKRVMASLSADERVLCARIFDRLVTGIGSKIAYPTRALAMQEIAGEGVTEDKVRRVLNKLTLRDTRILRPVETGAGDGFEIFHDVLGKPVLEWKQRLADEIAREEQEKVRQRESEAIAELRRQQRESDTIAKLRRGYLGPTPSLISELNPPKVEVGAHPPKPRLTLRVGIAGHRPNKLLAPTVGPITQQLSVVFADIESALTNIRTQNASAYADEPHQVRLICGLAEGTDLIAVAACPSHWPIEAVLPFPQDEYLNDFHRSAAVHGRDVTAAFMAALKRAQSITEFPMPPPNQRDQGYIVAGSYMLRQIDLLVVVWDGKPSRSGGTGAMAREAFDAGIPVVWLHSEESVVVGHSDAEISGGRGPRLISSFEISGEPCASVADCTHGQLAAVLARIFAVPHEEDRTTSTGLRDFFGEPWRVRRLAGIVDVVRRLAVGQWPHAFIIRSHYREGFQREWAQFFSRAPHVRNLQQRLEQILLPRYLWVDALAAHYYHSYQNAYGLSYLLAAVAIFGAVFTPFAHTNDATLIVGLIALISLSLASLLTAIAKKWQHRWRDYRALAERFRHDRFLSFVSEFGRTVTISLDRKDFAPPWTLWYYQATMRELGLPSAVFKGTYQWQLMHATLFHELESRAAYERATSWVSLNLDRFLRLAAQWCFVVAFSTWLLFLILIFVQTFAYWLGIRVKLESVFASLRETPLLIFLTAGLPTLGIAIAALRALGDFESRVEQSFGSIDSMSELRDEFKHALERNPRFDDTAGMLLRAAHALSDDRVVWQALYGRKRLMLPA